MAVARLSVRRFFILLGKTGLAVLSIVVVLFLYAEGYAIWYFEQGLGLPDESRLTALPITGPLCSATPGNPFVPLSEIPPLLRKALVASGDRDFYERPGVGPLAQITLALASGRPPSGSNIVSSVSRSCLRALTPDCCNGQPSLGRQVGEMVFMGRLERTFTRDRILEAYLNNAYLGRGTYGVAAAATFYYGKPLASLDIDEIAFLVLRFRMADSRSHDREGRERIIDKMLSAGLIDEAQARAAKAAPLPTLDRQPRDL